MYDAENELVLNASSLLVSGQEQFIFYSVLARASKPRSGWDGIVPARQYSPGSWIRGVFHSTVYLLKMSGGHLCSHIVTNVVFSAGQVLTVVFGMGTGVAPDRIVTSQNQLL